VKKVVPSPLRAVFLRTEGARDRIYVTRSDGSEVSWVFPTYGDALPHDLVHLVVETVFSLSRGFWGRVDDGADPGRISQEANRKGGSDKYAAFGPDQSDLQLAEVLAAAPWFSEDVVQEIRQACAANSLMPPEVNQDRIREVRESFGLLQARWASSLPKGSLSLTFDAASPRAGLSILVM